MEGMGEEEEGIFSDSFFVVNKIISIIFFRVEVIVKVIQS